MKMKTNSEEKVALITGATGGIGSAIAQEFYNIGTKLILTGRNETKIKSLSEKMPNNTEFIALDLSAFDAEKKLINYAIEKFGKIDILVNNAAIVEGGFFLKTDNNFLQRMFEVNFFTPYRLMQQTLPYMLKNKFGRIINMTSVAGEIGDAGMSVYSASKGALAAASKSIAAEYGRKGVTINCIAPGPICTEVIQKIPQDHAELLKSQIPLRRFGTPEEVASLAVYLASEKASYINGQVININGGLYR